MVHAHPSANVPTEPMAPGGHPDAFFLRHGDTVGRYTILELLGTGGTGAVYRARDNGLDRVVALKLLRAGSAASSADRARFLGEAHTLARLSHPNIVTVFDIGELDGQVFIAMELIDGVSLRDWLADRPRGWRQVRDVFLAAGRGLEAAHRVGLIHRDFKPQNVIIAGERVVVVDFGLARPVAAPAPRPASPSISDEISLTASGVVLGTPAYMSPEQHDGEPLTPRSDVWSFSVSLFEALYGERPFRGLNVADLSFKIRQPIHCASRRRVPRFLARLVRRGLAVEPAGRPATMGAVLAALAHDPAPRRRRLVLVLAILAALAATTLATRALDRRAYPSSSG